MDQDSRRRQSELLVDHRSSDRHRLHHFLFASRVGLDQSRRPQERAATLRLQALGLRSSSAVDELAEVGRWIEVPGCDTNRPAQDAQGDGGVLCPAGTDSCGLRSMSVRARCCGWQTSGQQHLPGCQHSCKGPARRRFLGRLRFGAIRSAVWTHHVLPLRLHAGM